MQRRVPDTSRVSDVNMAGYTRVKQGFIISANVRYYTPIVILQVYHDTNG